MPSQKEKAILATIIDKYKEMPYLWQKNHKYYKQRSMRDEGFNILLEIYKKYDERYTAKMLKKKLENMRTSYARELKKVTADTNYIPSLWYYDAMSFLAPYTACNVTATDPLENTNSSSDDEDVSIANSSNSLQKKEKSFTPLQKQENTLLSAKKNVTQNKEESDDYTDHIYLAIASSDEETSSVANSTSKRYKRKKKETQFQKQEKVILSKDNIMIQKEEEWEVYGRSIGIQIKDLSKRQLTIAQKLISDVIFYAKLDQLTESSYVVRMPSNDEFHEQNRAYKSSPSPSPSH